MKCDGPDATCLRKDLIVLEIVELARKSRRLEPTLNTRHQMLNTTSLLWTIG
jgi:hypothetical protein